MKMIGRIFLLMQLLHLAVSLSLKSSTSSLLPETCGYRVESAIFSGAQTHPGAYPWMAVLAYKDTSNNHIFFGCIGSVINERYILTAAHCLKNTPEYIRLGEWDVDTDNIKCGATEAGLDLCVEPVQDITPEEIVIHPAYRTGGSLVSYDIALIRLTKPINLLAPNYNVHPVCLPERDFNTQTLVDQTATVTGWGFRENLSNIMLQARVSYVDLERCNATYRGKLGERQICFGGEQSDLCGGDAGSPLVIQNHNSGRFTQVGFFSFGPVLCGHADVPFVYTSVAEYREWIEQNLRP